MNKKLISNLFEASLNTYGIITDDSEVTDSQLKNTIDIFIKLVNTLPENKEKGYLEVSTKWKYYPDC